MLFQKKKSINLTKLFFTLDSNLIITVDWLAENIFPYCKSLPINASRNFKHEKNISTLNGIVNFSLTDIIYFSNQFDNDVLKIGKCLRMSKKLELFDCKIVSNFDPLFIHEQEMINKIQSRFNLLYGYSRQLREDYSPVGETKINKGFFGISVKTESPDVWLMKPNELEEGAVKGIYPVNYWNDVAVSRLKEVGFQLPNSYSSSNNLYSFNVEQQQEIIKLNPQLSSFLRFDNLES